MDFDSFKFDPNFSPLNFSSTTPNNIFDTTPLPPTTTKTNYNYPELLTAPFATGSSSQKEKEKEREKSTFTPSMADPNYLLNGPRQYSKESGLSGLNDGKDMTYSPYIQTNETKTGGSKRRRFRKSKKSKRRKNRITRRRR